MDLKVYYRKVREVEEATAEPEVVIVSLDTADGGLGGVRTEVRRKVAARLIVEGKARLARPEEAAEFREQAREAKRVAEQQAAAARMQVTVVSEADLRMLRSARKQ